MKQNMGNIKKFSNINLYARLALLFLAILPLLFWQPFYEHFKVYLTGTVFSGVITEQWHLVVFFVILFMAFAIPLNYRKRAKWVDYSLVGAFFVSLFVEMYGVPLSLLFFSKYLFLPGAVFPPNVIEFSFLGVGLGMDHAMVYGSILMILGGALIVFGWASLYRQAKQPGFASNGLYAYSRHPQYLGFILLVIGWLFGWPTLITVAFCPILVYKYVKAARIEERYMINKYNEEYLKYKNKTPFLL